MLQLNFNPFPSLTTERLNLRRIRNEDVEEIFFFRSDKQMQQFLDRDPVASVEEAIDWIKMVNESIEENQSITWGVALKTEATLIGTISFWNVKKEHHRAEIGYALHPSLQGKGFMQEAMDAVLNYGFKIMKLHSVEANVNPANAKSIKLLERNNFIREAYHRENYYYNGRFLDSAIYSLITPFNNKKIG
jgi:ribosomal-protein-alanine N-acetyltransferase